MTRLLSLISIFAILLNACEGDPGPPGPQGEPGINIVADAFEETVTFSSGNSFQVTFTGLNLIDSDVILTYLQWELSDGTLTWRPLPQNVFFDDGVLIYNFDFTQNDVTFFLDGTIDPNTLDTVWTDNQRFRVVIVPADAINGVDVSNLNEVMQFYGITEFPRR